MKDSFNIITELPIWLIVICIAVGLLVSGILYYKNHDSKEQPKWLQYTLFSIRFLLVTFLCFLTLGPVIKYNKSTIEKPLIIIAQDNSKSIVLSKDSSFNSNELPKELEKFKNNLSDFEFKHLQFGEKTAESNQSDYKDLNTNYSQLLNEIDNRYSGRNIGAVVLLSDGIINQGSDGLDKAKSLDIPFYTVGLGDTSERVDISIKEINHNKLALLGNQFPVEIVLNASKCLNQKYEVRITQDGNLLFKSEGIFNNSNAVVNLNAVLKAQKPGMQRYKVSVSSGAKEYNLSNNSADFYIDVIDQREKILILAAAPHPDINALKQVIDNNENYQIDFELSSKFNGKLNDYGLIITHNLFSDNAYNSELVNRIIKSEINTFHILGANCTEKQINKASIGLSLSLSKNSTNETQANINKDFTLFNFSDILSSRVSSWPPLVGPYGRIDLTGESQTFLKQQIGNVKVDLPLLVFTQNSGRKSGFLLGEGIWKWRLNEYAQQNNSEAFNELITKSIQYLSGKINKSQFRVNGKTRYNQNEEIIFDGEVYNNNFELNNSEEVSIQLLNKEGKNYSYSFYKTNNAYRLNAGQLAPGEYTYRAQTKINGKSQTVTGKFIIESIVSEFNYLTANHKLLNNVSVATNGKFYLPNQFEMLSKDISDNEDLKPIIYEQNELNDLINFKIIFLILIALASLEWFLRKYYSLY